MIEEKKKWALLRQNLKPGAEAAEHEFIPLNADEIIAEAKARKKKRQQILNGQYNDQK
jgi:hypothetical protein